MARLVARVILAALFLSAGTVHLLIPQLFLPIMPPWIPQPLAGIVISGVAELLGGLGLLVPWREVRRAAGWGLLLLLVAVFPANIYMAAAPCAGASISPAELDELGSVAAPAHPDVRGKLGHRHLAEAARKRRSRVMRHYVGICLVLVTIALLTLLVINRCTSAAGSAVDHVRDAFASVLQVQPKNHDQ